MKKYSKPIKEKNILLDSYWFYGDLNLMLNCTSQGYLWLINNYINIACLKEKSPKGILFFDSDLNEPYKLFYNCPFLNFQKFSLSDIGFISKYNIVNFMKEQIDNNNFVSFIIDRYFFRKLGYKQMNSQHEIMIYGYDDINQLFYIGDNSNTGKYEIDMQCTFAELTQAYDTIHGTIYLFKVEKNNDYNLDIKQITEALDLYINPNRNTIIYNNPKPCVFGVDIYDEFEQYYDYVANTGDYSHFNNGVSVLYDHKKLMKFRLKYLTENNIISNNELYNSYKDIEKKILLIRNRQIKYLITGNTDLLKRNVDDLKDIKEKEIFTLTQMIDELKTTNLSSSLIAKKPEIKYDEHISPLLYNKISKNNVIYEDYIKLNNDGFISFSDINMRDELYRVYFMISNIEGKGKLKLVLDNENGEVLSELELNSENNDKMSSYYCDIKYISTEKFTDERDIYIIAESDDKNFSFNLHSIFIETIYHKNKNICNISCPKKHGNIDKHISSTNEIEYYVDLHNGDLVEYDIALNKTGSINIILENCKENDVVEIALNNISNEYTLGSDYKQCITIDYSNGNERSLLSLKNKTPYYSHIKITDIGRNINIAEETLAIYRTKTKDTQRDFVPQYDEYTVSHINPGSYIMFSNVNFYKDVQKAYINVASMDYDNIIEIRLDNIDGVLIGKGEIDYTSGFYNFYTMECDVAGVQGIHDLYFVFRGRLFNMFSFKFE